MSVKGPDSELLPRESFRLSAEFSLVADTVIVDSRLGRGTVPPAVLRALLGVGVSGFSLSRRFRVRTFGGGTELYWNNPEVDHDELRALQKGILKKKAKSWNRGVEWGVQRAWQWACVEACEQDRVSDRSSEPCGSFSKRRVGKELVGYTWALIYPQLIDVDRFLRLVTALKIK